MSESPKRRLTDSALCRLAMYGKSTWDFIDKRQIDAYAISMLILWGTVRITDWAMGFVAAHPEVDGLKSAAVIAAVMAPLSALQAAAIRFLFDARSKTFSSEDKP